MKIYLSFILLFVGLSVTAQQQQEVYKLDSCVQFGANPFDDVVVRVQQTAKWKTKKPSLESHLEKFFDDYTQKRAGGKITISLLVNSDGKPCTYEVRPNSNVRPDMAKLKAWMDMYEWEPAINNGKPVRSFKTLQISFEGKKITITELD
ncbi:hypothetical protein ESA94_00455 [Lacibacter luteus]|uniref:TonB C-terminal domain-containing protein n=1 Tax=Lacibacter luteus TaxID=2508719 RepID=A0A4Q1CKP5_9BACT|nr:hypothetical protein [Lacibacter luteus]RXK61526.1 hypothetical protein ESA94_00455 [Lacibacter luteus]